MNTQSEAAVLVNDLDSMVHRIEALPAHPRYTDALTLVQAAKVAINEGRMELHQRETRERYAKANG